MRLCPQCQVRPSPRLYAGRPVPCRACIRRQRLAYWKDRDDGKDFTPAQIEARYQRAKAEQRYQAALRRLGRVA